MTDRILKVDGVSKSFDGFPALKDVSFNLDRAETLGIVGESGSGKTTVARCILRAFNPDSGSIVFNSSNGEVDLVKLTHKQLIPLRKEMQMIFQDPYSSLNPQMTVRQIVEEPLVIHGVSSRGERLER